VVRWSNITFAFKPKFDAGGLRTIVTPVQLVKKERGRNIEAFAMRRIEFTRGHHGS